MKTPEDEAFDDLAQRQGDWGGGFPAKKAMAADKLQEFCTCHETHPMECQGCRANRLAQSAQEPVTEREALEIALDYVLRTTYWTEGRDRHDTLKAIKEALAQPWPDLTKRDRESYQKGHNDGVAHHKKSVKAAQPVQEPHEYDWSMLEAAEESLREHMARIKELEAALAQPEQEPVAWKETDEVECPVCKDKGFPWPKCGHITYLERTQPQRTWVGLTDDELLHIGVATGLERAAAQMIADKLKEKNT